MSLLDQIDPVRDLLVVIDDEVDRELASGIVIPESAKVVIETGIVMKVGPLSVGSYEPGRRIAFKPYGGVPLAFDSEVSGKAIRIVSPADVRCFLDSGGAPLAVESMGEAEPPPGYMLVERVEMPLFRGKIALSVEASQRTRSVEVIVHSVGIGVDQYRPGDRVLLAHAAGIEVKFGTRGEKSLWKVLPSNVLAMVSEGTGVTHEGLSVEGAARELTPEYEDNAWEEGDTMGLL